MSDEIIRLGLAGIALWALLVALNGRNQDDKSQNLLSNKLVDLIGSFQQVMKSVSGTLELLIVKSQMQLDSMGASTVAIGANTTALVDMNRRLSEDFMPSVMTALAGHQESIKAEFKPVVELLSTIGVGVNAHNKALLEHRKNEEIILQQQQVLNTAMINAEKLLENIFHKMVESENVITPSVGQTIAPNADVPVVETNIVQVSPDVPEKV